MREDLRCSLNGVDMLSLDPRLYIEDIEETIKFTAETGKRAAYGQTLTGIPGRDSVTVSVTFKIKERDRTSRQSVIQLVNGWAKSGWLTINTRPYQRLYVTCTQPANYKVFSWSEDMTVAFTAYDEAYWQDAVPARVSLSGTDASVSVTPRGTRACCLQAEITNASGGTVNTLSLAANNSQMAFEGLALAAGKTLVIAYDERHLLTATVDGVSKLSCRTAASADDLWIDPRKANPVRFVAARACSVSLILRGEYD